MVRYDGTVRNAGGDILQFCYGEDGMDAAALERQNVELIRWSDSEMQKRCRVDVTDPKLALNPNVLKAELYESLLVDPTVQEALDMEWAELGRLRSL